MDTNGRPACHDLRKFNGWVRIDDPSGKWWGLVCSLDSKASVKEYLQWARSEYGGVIETIILPPGVLPEEEPPCPCFRAMKFRSKKH